MGQLINTIDTWTLVRLLGGLSIVISAVVGFLASIARDHIGNRSRANLQKDLESLKHQFNRAELLMNNLASSGSSTYLATIERRLDHFQNVWDAMLRIKRSFPTLGTYAYTVLKREELIGLPTSQSVGLKATIDSFNPSKYIDDQFEIVMQAESSRPFVGQLVWNVFFSYQALHGRLVYLLQEGLFKGKVSYWLDDKSFLDQAIGISITPDNLAKLTLNDVMAFRNVQNYLELQLVVEIQAQTSGSAAIKETVRQAEQLTKAMASASIAGL
jgi:hypothetical protein